MRLATSMIILVHLFFVVFIEWHPVLSMERQNTALNRLCVSCINTTGVSRLSCSKVQMWSCKWSRCPQWKLIQIIFSPGSWTIWGKTGYCPTVCWLIPSCDRQLSDEGIPGAQRGPVFIPIKVCRRCKVQISQVGVQMRAERWILLQGRRRWGQKFGPTQRSWQFAYSRILLPEMNRIVT